MEQETITRFQLLLEMEKHRLLGNAKNAREALAAKTEGTGDEADEAQSLNEQHVAIRFKERERQLLHKINDALEKIRNGTFGECEDCGGEIGTKRLEIRPVATLCIKCKELEEKSEKAYSQQT